MATLVSNAVNIHKKGDNRILFVPFDNDTFVRYDAKSMQNELRNTSSEISAFYENRSRYGLIVGSVEHTTWKTGIKTVGKNEMLSELVIWGGYTDEKVTRDTMAHGSITGTSLKSPKIFVGYFPDWRCGMDTYAKANRIAEHPYIFNWDKPTPFG
ncbi:MAG: hypothetical protein ACOH2A_05740 [Sphingobacteriaceae bacterium]